MGSVWPRGAEFANLWCEVSGSREWADLHNMFKMCQTYKHSQTIGYHAIYR